MTNITLSKSSDEEARDEGYTVTALWPWQKLDVLEFSIGCFLVVKNEVYFRNKKPDDENFYVGIFAMAIAK